jgi:hypothetical protein
VVRWRTALAVVVFVAPVQQSVGQSAWEPWVSLPGVFDVAGPRSDGQLVVAEQDRLVLLSPSGQVSAFAPTYSTAVGTEAYIAMSPGISVDGTDCSFARDEVFALNLKASPPGVTRIDANGNVSELASVPGVSTLGGIALDTVGSFGHRLLVAGAAAQSQVEVAAIDCKGTVSVIAMVPVPIEGGMAVAPRDFGTFGGQLIAPNEQDGSVYAVSSDGRTSMVAPSGEPAGADIGVESVGFVPSSGAAMAYLADRGTASNPHAGTDHLLRLDHDRLNAMGALPGDLLVATEGGANVVVIRCSATCAASRVAEGSQVAHAEGRLLLVASPAAPEIASTTAPRIVPTTTVVATTTLQPASPASRPARRSGALVPVVAVSSIVVIAGAAMALVAWRRTNRSSGD